MIKNSKRTVCGRLFILVILLLSASYAQAQSEEKETAAVPTVVKKSEKLADQVKMDKEYLNAVDSLLMQISSDEEDDIFPSDELYDGQWNNDYVKSYGDVTVPETYPINISDFTMPIEGRVTSHYGKRRRRFHYGTDIKLQVGDTVRAAFDGKVRISKYEKRGYGNFLVIRHSNGLETVYGHLSEALVSEGENVTAGQTIALGGNTGRSSGPHLHFEFRFLGRALNPEEIVDFDQFCTKDEVYVYEKGKSELPSASSKYLAKGKGKIIYYRVKQGDTLGAVARKTGISVNTICKLNKIKPSTTLKVGKAIRLS